MEKTEARLLREIDRDDAHRPELTRLAQAQPTLLAWLSEQVGDGGAERKLAGVARYQVAVALRVLELMGEPIAVVDRASLDAAQEVVADAVEASVADQGSFVDRASRLPKSRPALLDALLAGMFASGPSQLDEHRKARAWYSIVEPKRLRISRFHATTQARDSSHPFSPPFVPWTSLIRTSSIGGARRRLPRLAPVE